MKNYLSASGRRGLRLLFAAAFVILLGAPSALAQSEYSDAWLVDDETVYTDEQSTPQADLAGIGVSDASYDSGVYSTSTYTTLTGPGGTAISDYSSGYNYAYAEAFSLKIALDMPPDQEQEYNVNSQHTYYKENYCGGDPSLYKEQPAPDQPCYVSEAGDGLGARFQRAAFGLPGAAPARRQFYYWVSYSYFAFFLSIKFTGYQFAGAGYAGCNANNGGEFGYSAFCPLNNICQKAAKCAPAAAPGIQGIGVLLRAIFFSTCTVKYYYVPMRPKCS